MQQPPTAEQARDLVRAALGDGGLEVRPVEQDPAAADLGTADPARLSWWAGSGHVLRLALDRPATGRLARELRLRDLVRSRVGVRLPLSAAAGEWAPGLGYSVDTRLPGASADQRPVSAAGESDLAELLAGLRTVPVARAAALGLAASRPRALESLRARAAEATHSLAGSDEQDVPLRELTPGAVRQLTPPPEGCVVHGRFTGDHLAVGGDGRVRGVLGWAGASVGDPAEDIAGLAVCVGAPAAVRAATLAGYDARTCLRGLWLARCDALVRLADRLRGQGTAPLGQLRAWQRRAWEPILLERLSELPTRRPAP
ncbi:aminoglycoside phosphotransferase family protein [Streptomyces sp. NPDC058045]|uniref:aminoglycoside phosphotransferase family protein n=1 Tax=Streptomyces sp. NPDC058045 TaxID=3346311 RepID=UPI0036E234CF